MREHRGATIMSTSDFERNCKQLRKKYNFESTEDFMNDLSDLFVKSIGQGEDFSLELMDYCLKSDSVEDKDIEMLSDMVDLFHLDYNNDYNSLALEDWVFIKDLVNVWALEMDMDTVTYIMQQVVDSGAFD
jgi:hypothetical protein